MGVIEVEHDNVETSKNVEMSKNIEMSSHPKNSNFNDKWTQLRDDYQLLTDTKVSRTVQPSYYTYL